MARGLPEGIGPIEPFTAKWETGSGIAQFGFDDRGIAEVTYEWWQIIARHLGWEEIHD